jgi:hypothetical protein
MGYGDEIMASYYAKGAYARGKRIAFGNGRHISWHGYAHQIFRNNPNVAPPGSERDVDIEWINHSYRGNRPYNRRFGDQWLWLTGFGNRPGEIFFDDEELRWAEQFGKDFVIVEPNVPAFKSVAPNKQWRVERYAEVAHHLTKAGYEVLQFLVPPPYGPGHKMQSATSIKAPTFRHALALMQRARFFIGPEGGLHHGAAAVGTPGTVIFGGFISPQITGYDIHINLFAGREACGSFYQCKHCREALDAISVQHVMHVTMEKLNAQKAAA